MSAFAGVTRSAAWVLLGVAGQGAALQLVEAGPTVRYQHYAAPDMLLSRERAAFLAIIVVQALICSIAVTRQPAIRTWLRTTFSAGKLLCMTLVFVLASAALSRSLPAYAFELAMAALVQASANRRAGPSEGLVRIEECSAADYVRSLRTTRWQ